MTDLPPPNPAIGVVLHSRGADASGRFQEGRIVVNAGSKGRRHAVPSLPERLRRRREELIADGSFEVDGDSLVATRDIEFDSPSGAATVLIGRDANGWRHWRLSDGTPIDQLRVVPVDVREASFRRRWYEAHRDVFESDSAAVAHERVWQEDSMHSAAEALALLDILGSDRDAEAFGSAMQTWAAKPTTPGFNGFSGQMLLNQLVKRSEDQRALADLLVRVLAAPRDEEDALTLLGAFVEYIESIRVGAHPAPGHAPFFVSYFWAMHSPDEWPIVWPKSAAFLEFVTGQPLPSSPCERLREFVVRSRDLDDDVQRFAQLASWWSDTKPVLLDPVLVDRCEFGINESLPLEARNRNAAALVTIADHIGSALAERVSAAADRPMVPAKPARTWRGDQPRGDLWVDWRAHESGIGLRVWVNHNGASVGLRPGWVRNGWYDEAAPIVQAKPLDGFRMIAAPWSKYGDDVGHVGGLRGEFAYARWFEPPELADLNVVATVTSVARSLRPHIADLLRLGVGQVPVMPDDALMPFVDRFNETVPDSPADAEQRADRQRFAELLAPEQIGVSDIAELRLIWNTGRWGGPGVMPTLNRTIRDADAAEYDRIIDAFRYLCWGDDPDEVRIDKVLDDPQYRVTGLGESVILKMLAICHPDRYIPVFPYSGANGKRVMLQTLGLPEPSGSRGEIQVAANRALRDRLEPFFPNDPWRMASFLYWYTQLDREPTVVPLSEQLDKLAEELLVDPGFLHDVVALLEDKGQVVFYGPPGTGKTYVARRLAEVLAGDPTRQSLVQFHPSTAYEDFFEGYRPEDNDDGTMSYRLTRGPLALLAQRAATAPTKRHVMVIDELNRANLPRVFGELLFLLEYRNESVRTLYRPEDAFELPGNLYFIGTMNTADRSIALVDAALRRRFHFVPFFPNHGPMKGLLERWLERTKEPAWVGELVAKVNDQLAVDLGGPHLQIGPSNFMRRNLDRDSVRRIWEYNIEPFIEDQFFGDQQKLERYRFDKVVDSYLREDVLVGSLEELEGLRAADGDINASPVVPLVGLDGDVQAIED